MTHFFAAKMPKKAAGGMNFNSSNRIVISTERTQISYLATFPTSPYVAFFQRKPQGADQRHQASQEIWGSEVEGPAASLPVLTHPL
jgi:hypothetical protein